MHTALKLKEQKEKIMNQSVYEIIEKIYEKVDEQLIKIRAELIKKEFDMIEKDHQQVINAMAATIEELEEQRKRKEK